MGLFDNFYMHAPKLFDKLACLYFNYVYNLK